MVAEYNQYALWPVRSLKLDDLQAAFVARQDRDNCALTTALDVADDGTVAGVVVSSAAVPGAVGVPAVCSAPLLLPGGPNAGTPRVVTVVLPPGGSARATVSGIVWPRPAAPVATAGELKGGWQRNEVREQEGDNWAEHIGDVCTAARPINVGQTRSTVFKQER